MGTGIDDVAIAAPSLSRARLHPRWLSLASRAFVLVCAVVQLALPVAAALGDAFLQENAPRALSGHVESTSRATCTPVHSDDCVLCRCVQHFAAAGTDASDHSWIGVELAPPLGSADLPPTTEDDSQRLPRAPPTYLIG